jgi:hypothetical protein
MKKIILVKTYHNRHGDTLFKLSCENKDIDYEYLKRFIDGCVIYNGYELNYNNKIYNIAITDDIIDNDNVIICSKEEDVCQIIKQHHHQDR